MNIVEVKTYLFDELSDEAKEKALDDHRNYETEFEWYEGTYENWTEKLVAMGYQGIDIQFSGFWSQGDGASFTAESVNLAQWMKSQKLAGKFRALYQAALDGNTYASINRTQWHNYVHHNTITSNLDVEYQVYDNEKQAEKIELQAHDVEQLLEDHAREMSQEIYSELEREYEWLTSDENVAEALVANEVTFTEDGSTF